MSDTGEDRELKQRANANEAEVIRKSKNLVSKTKADLDTTEKAPRARPGLRRFKPGNDRMVRQWEPRLPVRML